MEEQTFTQQNNTQTGSNSTPETNSQPTATEGAKTGTPSTTAAQPIGYNNTTPYNNFYQGTYQQPGFNQLNTFDYNAGQISQQLNNNARQAFQGLQQRYSSYFPQNADLGTLENLVSYLPANQAINFMNELNAIKYQTSGKLQQEVLGMTQLLNQQKEALKSADKVRYKDDEVVFNAWYNPPQSIDDVASLVNTIRKAAIDSYLKEQAVKQEDDSHKSKLTTSRSSSGLKVEEGHIFTRAELAKMTKQEFVKYEKEISRQVAEGLVR